MSKIQVVNPHTLKPTGEYLKKSAALTLIRRNLAAWHEFGASLYRRTIREFVQAVSQVVEVIHVPDILPPLDWYPGYGKWPKVHC